MVSEDAGAIEQGFGGGQVAYCTESDGSHPPGASRAIDCINVSDELLRDLLKTNRALRFDWENKWLRGDQYAHMLNNIDVYKEAFGMPKLAEKQHPENIYLEPQSKCPKILTA